MNINEEKLRVLVVDDQSSIRKILFYLLQKQSHISSIREAVNGREAVQIARDFRPDVILMDVSMPEMNGIDATKIIISELPQTRVIGLSMYDDAETTQSMLNAGAAAFLAKTAPVDILLSAIHTKL